MEQVLEYKDLDLLIQRLADTGYQVIGPTVRDGAIVYAELSSSSDLPIGWTDEQSPGLYRLKKRQDNAAFGFVVGPHSWKRYLYPPVQTLWRASKEKNGFVVEAAEEEIPKYAFLGVRACELSAMQVQDRVFIQDHYTEKRYASIRESAICVAVNCVQAASTCFCSSMETGPRVEAGYDIALTEILADKKHYFVIRAGTELGEEILNGLPLSKASPANLEAEEKGVETAREQMGRKIDTDGIRELFYRNYDHPQWEDVASRCIGCTNCTMVCPTCFCSSVEEVSDLAGENTERVRKWDSCFSQDFSYVHGGNIRSSIKSRYRQWLTHKLATWIDQFGTSGCVGCGRCITWCPAGIDLTEEVRAMQNTDGMCSEEQSSTQEGANENNTG